MRKPTGKPMGRPAKYVKPFLRTYRVSQSHIERINDLRTVLMVSSNSDVIEEAVLKLHRRYFGQSSA